jgi:hypothetical protein
VSENDLIRTWAVALGMPPDGKWVQIATRGPIAKGRPVTILDVSEAAGRNELPVETSVLKKWQGYSFELFGLVVDEVSTEWPGWQFEIPLEGGRTRTVTVQVWRQTAWAPDSPLFATAVWSPAMGSQRSIRMDGDDFTDDDLKSAGQAMRLILKLDALHRRGKREGDGAIYTDKQLFLQDLAGAVFDAQGATGRARPGASAVMRRLNLRKTAFYDYVKTFTGKRWAEVESNYAELRGIGRVQTPT